MPTLADIASLLGCAPPPGSERQPIGGVSTLEEAAADQIAVLASEQYVRKLQDSKAAAVIASRKLSVPPEWQPRTLSVDNADLAVIKILKLFAPPVPRPTVGIDSTARVADGAIVDASAAIGPNVIVGRGTTIGRDVVLHAGVIVGDDVKIGDACELFPHVVVRERITIGNRVVIHAGSVLGTDGFGYHWDGSAHQKVPHIGTVIVEDDVEIGSCVCIDRAKFSTTRIGRGTKIDNLVQVGHNVQIGAHCVVVGQVGLGGSARLGTGVVLGGQAAIRDHIALGDAAMVAACSAVADDVPPRTIVSGMPALPHRQTLREQAALRNLPELRSQVKALQEQLKELTKRLQDDGV